MSFTPHREIASAVLIDRLGRLLLQRRDDIPGILYPGRIGLFGGHREGNETFLECVVREIHEEIGYFVNPEKLEQLAKYNGVDPGPDGGTFHVEIFLSRDLPIDGLVITEGSLLIIKPGDVIALDLQLTPSAQFAMKVLMNRGV